MADILTKIIGGGVSRDAVRLLIMDMATDLLPLGMRNRPQTAGRWAKTIGLEFANRLLNPKSDRAKKELFRAVRNEILKYTPREKMRAPYYHGMSAFGRGTGPSPRAFNHSDPVTNRGRFRRAILAATKFWELNSSASTEFLDAVKLAVSFVSMKDLGAARVLPYLESVDQGFVRDHSYFTTGFVSYYNPKRRNIVTGSSVGKMKPRSSTVTLRGKQYRQPGAKGSSMRYDFMNLNRYGGGTWRSVKWQYLKGGKTVYGHQMMAAGFDKFYSQLEKYQEAVLVECINEFLAGKRGTK